MRIWSLSPVFLDKKGLISLWSEIILLHKIISGQTEAYKKHPQVVRFLSHPDPKKLLLLYLNHLNCTALIPYKKGIINFKLNKIGINSLSELHNINPCNDRLNVSSEQLKYEFFILQRRLYKRNRKQWFFNKKVVKEYNRILTNLAFNEYTGPVQLY